MSNTRPAVIVRKVKTGIVPVSAYDAEVLDAYMTGVEFNITARTRRSNPQNRLYWSVLTRIVASTWLGDKWPTAKKLHKALLREVGMVEVSFDLDGSPRIVEDSTAFDNMRPEEFKPYFDAAMARLAELTGIDPLADAAPETSLDASHPAMSEEV